MTTAMKWGKWKIWILTSANDTFWKNISEEFNLPVIAYSLLETDKTIEISAQGNDAEWLKSLLINHYKLTEKEAERELEKYTTKGKIILKSIKLNPSYLEKLRDVHIIETQA